RSRTMRGGILCVLGAALAELASTASDRVPLAYNLHSQVVPIMDRLSSGQAGREALIGDSIMFRAAYTSGLIGAYEAQYGSAGIGYRGCNGDFKFDGCSIAYA